MSFILPSSLWLMLKCLPRTKIYGSTCGNLRISKFSFFFIYKWRIWFLSFFFLLRVYYIIVSLISLGMNKCFIFRCFLTGIWVHVFAVPRVIFTNQQHNYSHICFEFVFKLLYNKMGVVMLLLWLCSLFKHLKKEIK